MLSIGDLFKRDVELGEMRKEAEDLAASNQCNISHIHLFIEEDIKRGWRPPEYSLDDLVFMKKGTLGNDLGLHLMRMSENQEYVHSIPGMIRFPIRGVISDKEYVKTRVRHTHDILHVLTGYNTSAFGETALQGFYAGQSMTTLSAILLFKVIATHVMNASIESRQHMSAMIDGIAKGIEAKSYCGLRHLEEELVQETDSVRRKLGIKECTSPIWGTGSVSFL